MIGLSGIYASYSIFIENLVLETMCYKIFSSSVLWTNNLQAAFGRKLPVGIGRNRSNADSQSVKKSEYI